MKYENKNMKYFYYKFFEIILNIRDNIFNILFLKILLLNYFI